jgi:hypothetical protein
MTLPHKCSLDSADRGGKDWLSPKRQAAQDDVATSGKRQQSTEPLIIALVSGSGKFEHGKRVIFQRWGDQDFALF